MRVLLPSPPAGVRRQVSASDVSLTPGRLPGALPFLSPFIICRVRLMEERCILITPEDVAYGEESKKTCAAVSFSLLGPPIVSFATRNSPGLSFFLDFF